MKIFLSFASNDKAAAEEIQLALLGGGHEVFFDKASLPPGSDYNSRIRAAIRKCDLYIYLLSPASVGSGRYVHSELSQIKKKWRKPWGRVLPVMLDPVEFDQIDPYLASATILDPDGNVATEVVAAIPTLPAKRKSKSAIVLSLAMIVMLCIAIISYPRVADWLRPEIQLTPIEVEELQRYLDMGDAFISIEEWQSALDEYTKALELSPAREDIKQKIQRIKSRVSEEPRHEP